MNLRFHTNHLEGLSILCEYCGKSFHEHIQHYEIIWYQHFVNNDFKGTDAGGQGGVGSSTELNAGCKLQHAESTTNFILRS